MPGTPILLLLSGTVLALAVIIWCQIRLVRQLVAATAAELSALRSRVDTLSEQLALVSQKVIPISSALQDCLRQELTHFHTPRMDELMQKLGPPWLLTDEEELELLDLLEARERDMGDQISPSERDAARIFPIIMKRAKLELQTMEQSHGTFRLLTVIAPMRGESAE